MKEIKIQKAEVFLTEEGDLNIKLIQTPAQYKECKESIKEAKVFVDFITEDEE